MKRILGIDYKKAHYYDYMYFDSLSFKSYDINIIVNILQKECILNIGRNELNSIESYLYKIMDNISNNSSNHSIYPESKILSLHDNLLNTFKSILNTEEIHTMFNTALNWQNIIELDIQLIPVYNIQDHYTDMSNDDKYNIIINNIVPTDIKISDHYFYTINKTYVDTIAQTPKTTSYINIAKNSENNLTIISKKSIIKLVTKYCKHDGNYIVMLFPKPKCNMLIVIYNKYTFMHEKLAEQEDTIKSLSERLAKLEFLLSKDN